MPLPSLADLKAHLNMTAGVSGNDAELSDMLEAAVDVVEGIVGPVLTAAATDVHAANGPTLTLSQVPVAGLVSVTQNGAAVDANLFRVEHPDSGIVRRVDGYNLVGAFTVTYTVGRAQVPAAIRLATLIIAAHLWETQRGNASGPIAAETADAFGPPPVAGYAVPNRARDLLARYVQPTLA